MKFRKKNLDLYMSQILWGKINVNYEIYLKYGNTFCIQFFCSSNQDTKMLISKFS